MNENPAHPEWNYRPRWLTPLLSDALTAFPVLILTGPRQTGKSTLLAWEPTFRDWPRWTLDDLDVLDQARRDPVALLAGRERIIVDEVQRAPGFLLAVKAVVDRDREVRVILTGSSNLLLMQRVGESLAGRAAYFSLLPMSLGELQGRPRPDVLQLLFDGHAPEGPVQNSDPGSDHLMFRGFLPPVALLEDDRLWRRWWESYVMTYLERDLRQLAAVASLPDFRNLMRWVAVRSGAIQDQTSLANELGMSQPTVHRYLNLLETSGLLVRVPAWQANRGKRLVKSPRSYFADPGLATNLAGFTSPVELNSARERGALFETLVLHHLRVCANVSEPPIQIHHWRTTTGAEVDFVAVQGRKMLALEVKASEHPAFRDTMHLRTFLDLHPECVAGIVVHDGMEMTPLGDRIWAIPWRWLGAG